MLVLWEVSLLFGPLVCGIFFFFGLFVLRDNGGVVAHFTETILTKLMVLKQMLEASTKSSCQVTVQWETTNSIPLPGNYLRLNQTLCYLGAKFDPEVTVLEQEEKLLQTVSWDLTIPVHSWLAPYILLFINLRSSAAHDLACTKSHSPITFVLPDLHGSQSSDALVLKFASLGLDGAGAATARTRQPSPTGPALLCQPDYEICSAIPPQGLLREIAVQAIMILGQARASQVFFDKGKGLFPSLQKRAQNIRERERTRGGPSQISQLTNAEQEAQEIRGVLACLAVGDGEMRSSQLPGNTIKYQRPMCYMPLRHVDMISTVG
ncbi:uncharacterized protein [Heterodontus francisci]|uniref:uncharacterized protein n=1 Tax=Heterodontus francisci TaxID=7792 RepID=UPI00355C7F41